MFRVTTTSMRESWLQATQQLQANLSRTQQQISTGQKFTRPAEDPVGATRALQIDGSLQQTQQFSRNADIAKNRLGLEESALGQVGNVLQRLRELAVQANNATQTNETRAAIADEARQQLDALVQLANTQDGAGEYLFGGYQTRTRPFAIEDTGVEFNGDQGERLLQIGPDRRIADSNSGYDVFMNIRNGNGTFVTTPAAANTGSGVVGASSVTDPTLYDGGTYTVRFTSATTYQILDSANVAIGGGNFTPGQNIEFAGVEFTIEGAPAQNDEFVVAPSGAQDLFRTVQNFIDTLSAGSHDEASEAQLHSALGRSFQELDQAIGNTLQVRSSVGSRLATVDAQENINADVELNLKSLLSDLRDLDYADALTKLQQQLTSMQAAQASFARTQGLSLFNYF